MITLLILEDNIIQLNALASILEQNLEHAIILKAPDYATAVTLLQNNQVQFFLLDIELEHNQPTAKTGIDFGNYIRSIPQYQITPILYITSIPDKINVAVNQTHCHNYILKPYTTEDILSAIQSLLGTPFVEPAPLQLCDTNGIYYKIYEKELLYIEADRKHMIIYTSSNVPNTSNHAISTFTTNQYRLIELSKMLSANFVQCHKKYIVNLKFIQSYDKTTSSIQLAKQLIPIGRKYKEEFEKRFLKKC